MPSTSSTNPFPDSQPQTPPTNSHNDHPRNQPSIPFNDPSSLLGPRSRRQFSLYIVSSTLLTLSILSTRRALLRRYQSTTPAYFQPSFPLWEQPLNLRKEAAEALRLATFNVLGFSALFVSGGLWAADISSLAELKTALGRLKKQRQVKGGRQVEKDEAVEKEFEDFIGPSMKRGEDGGKGR
ncbi:MAG: hypothetical protein LQ338_005371 [Usnochroma carphineum]|nr:MAG: hypothetical protein LQ338_005371 [Usnochroma carphineum]